MDKVLNFNVSRFIAEVRSRRLLYDPKCEAYSDKDAKARAWEEIVQVFIAGYDHQEEINKSELVVQLQKKWKNIRDTFVRENRNSKTSKKIRYRYYKQLMFLMETMKPREGTIQEEQEQEHLEDTRTIKKSKSTAEPISLPPGKTMFHSVNKKRKAEERSMPLPPVTVTAPPRPHPPPSQITPLVRREPSPDEESDRLFLLSLLSDLKRVPDQLKLEVKCELMNVIKRYSSVSCNNQDALQLNCVFASDIFPQEAPSFVVKSSPQHSSDESD